MADGDQRTRGAFDLETLATTNATAAKINGYTVPTSCIALVIGFYIAQEDDAAGHLQGGMIQCIAKNVSGTTTEYPTGGQKPSITEFDPTPVNWAPEFDTTSAVIQMDAVGGASDNVRWAGCLHVEQVEVDA